MKGEDDSPEPRERISAGTRTALALLVAATIGCDRVTKHVAVSELAGMVPRTFLAGAVRLEYAENKGAFLSLGADLPPVARTVLFTVGTGLILAGTIIAAFRLRLAGPRLYGLSLVFAGGVSNLVDRVTWGSTVDFMNVGIGWLRTGIFNVADVAVMAGLAMFLLGHRRQMT